MSLLTDSPFELIIHPHDSRFWVWQHVADPEVVAACIMHSQTSDVVDAELLKAANPDLKTISTFSVGYGMCEAEILGLMSDHIDLEGCKKKGIRLGHTPGVLSDAVADVAVMLVLMTMRRVEEGIALVKSGGVSVLLHRNCKSPFGTAVAVWFPSIEASLAPFQLALRLRRADVHSGPPSPGPPFVMCGPAISHPSLTLSFLGFGRISHKVLSRLLSFTSKSHTPTITYTSSRARPNQSDIDADFSRTFGVTVRRVEVDELARGADVLVVLCDMNIQTVGLVDKEFLERMKSTAILVNAARVRCPMFYGDIRLMGVVGTDCELGGLGRSAGECTIRGSGAGRDHRRAGHRRESSLWSRRRIVRQP